MTLAAAAAIEVEKITSDATTMSHVRLPCPNALQREGPPRPCGLYNYIDEAIGDQGSSGRNDRLNTGGGFSGQSLVEDSRRVRHTWEDS